MKPLRRSAITAALLVGVAFTAITAEAHPLSPSLLEVQEQGGGAALLRWTTPASRPLGRATTVVIPQGCRPTGTTETTRTPLRVTRRTPLDCEGASLVGKTLGVLGLSESKTSVIVRIGLADGRRIDGLLSAGHETMTIPSARSRADIASGYLRLGIEHIFGGIDHLLFVLALVLLSTAADPGVRVTAEVVRQRSRHHRILTAVTAFTAGHSVTLSAAFLGYVDVPRRLVESGIALSIAVLAAELATPAERGSLIRRRPWTAAFGFGLLHGFGFAAALSAAGLAKASIPLALASFNLGIEIGQLIFVAAVLLTRTALLRAASELRLASGAEAARLPAYGIGIVAAFWTLQRLLAGL